jgi:hypothetical protein
VTDGETTDWQQFTAAAGLSDVDVPVVGDGLRPLSEVRAETGFAWRCRRARIEDGRLTEVHQITGGDRAEYARHMQGHGVPPVKKTAFEQWTSWKPPRPVRAYKPKAMDPGQRVEWVKVTPAHWEGRDWNDPAVSPGQWVEEVRETRTGVIWSTADMPSAWYVQPDDSPACPVYVKRAGKRDWHHKEGELHEMPAVAEAARVGVLRAEIVRQRGIFPVIDSQRSIGRETNYIHVVWHSDPACPRAAGKEPFDPASRPEGVVTGYRPDGRGLRNLGQERWTPLDVADVLTSGGQPPGALCPECITEIEIADPVSPAPVSPASGNDVPGLADADLGDAVTSATGGELTGDSPYQAALAALDGYTATAAEIAQATEVLEAQLTIHGFDRDQVLMLHIVALREAATRLQDHARNARAGLITQHGSGAEYHASGRDAESTAFRQVG